MAEKQQEDIRKSMQDMDFEVEFSQNLPAIFKYLNFSLAFTSYQAERLILIRSDGEDLDINYKTFSRPMGLTANEDSLTLGTFAQIVKFQREDSLIEQIKQPLAKIEEDITAPRLKSNAKQTELHDDNSDVEFLDLTEAEKVKHQERYKRWQSYQESLYSPVDNRVDACYITRSSHYSGMINIHDIDWGDEGLWAVNSSFSCLCTIEPDFSFVPQWKPFFISELVPEDRCHLNGMALKDGKPAYVTTFSKFDEAAKWRDGEKFDGTLMDVASNRILLDGLSMPHSPRYHQGRLYFCDSGLGLVCYYDQESQSKKVIAEVPGFTRGVDFYGTLKFVGLSKVRQSGVTKPVPLAERYQQTYSGIWIFNLEDNSLVGTIKFTGNIDQIYDVAVLNDCSFPELIEPSSPRIRNHFCIPDGYPN